MRTFFLLLALANLVRLLATGEGAALMFCSLSMAIICGGKSEEDE